MILDNVSRTAVPMNATFTMVPCFEPRLFMLLAAGTTASVLRPLALRKKEAMPDSDPNRLVLEQ